MKKPLALCLTLFALLLTACGGGDMTTTTTTPTPVEQFVPTLAQYTPLKLSEGGKYTTEIYTYGVDAHPFFEYDSESESYLENPQTIPLICVGKKSFYNSKLLSKKSVTTAGQSYEIYEFDLGDTWLTKYSHSNRFHINGKGGGILYEYTATEVTEQGLIQHAKEYISSYFDVDFEQYVAEEGENEDLQFRKVANGVPTCEKISFYFDENGNIKSVYYEDYGIDWTQSEIDSEQFYAMKNAIIEYCEENYSFYMFYDSELSCCNGEIVIHFEFVCQPKEYDSTAYAKQYLVLMH